MSISAFVKIYSLGKNEIQNIFKGDVEVTEKVDGSQFDFGVDLDGNIVMRSKGKEIFLESYEKLFELAVEYIKNNKDKIKDVLKPGTYIYSEYLRKPKHNVLNYERVPKNNLIVFGVKEQMNYVVEYDKIKEYADKLGLDMVPLLYKGTIDTTRIEDGHGGYSYVGYDFLKRLINTTTSVIGGELIEGVVIKNYNQLTSVGYPHICCGKYVRESFKERHQKEWKVDKSDLTLFVESFRSEARWQKAVQHLQEKGELDNSLKDIGKLMKEVHQDIDEEETNEIKEFLYSNFIKQIKRKAVAGLPEWYKDKLLKKSFEEGINR